MIGFLSWWAWACKFSFPLPSVAPHVAGASEPELFFKDKQVYYFSLFLSILPIVSVIWKKVRCGFLGRDKRLSKLTA